jgi:hypothetical protein
MNPITINLDKIGAGWLYKYGLFDVIGYVLHHVEGVPLHLLEGYAAPNDAAYAILISGAHPGTKDVHIAKLNMLMAMTSDFRDREEVAELAKANDLWCQGDLTDLQFIEAAKLLLGKLGYSPEFTKEAAA